MSGIQGSSSRGVFLKTNFEVSSKIDAFYTGGKIQFSASEEFMFCLCGDKLQILCVESGKVVHSLKEEADEFSCFAASPDNQFIVTASKSLLLRQWIWNTEEQVKSWKAIHVAPIVSMTFDATSTLLATGSSDSTIKVWDITKQYYTHNFRGSQGVVSLVCFHPDPKCLHLFSASTDCKIRIWDLMKSRCLGILESHYSVVTSLAFSSTAETMVSSSRDNVLILWDLPNRKAVKTIPAFEGVESVIMLPNDAKFPGNEKTNKEYFMTAGTKGALRVWSLPEGHCVHLQSVLTRRDDAGSASGEILHAACCENLGKIAVVTFDHNIVLYDLETLSRHKQFVGYNDEVLDLCFAGRQESHVAVATNSDQLRVYDVTTMDCQLLEGHSSIVLALAANNDGTMLVTGSKDHTIRIWKINDTNDFQCIGTGKGHTHAVGTVAWARLDSSFVVSGSQDLTIKFWTVPEVTQDDIVDLVVKATHKAHDKDINSVAVSPNDKLLATGSQDKTAKVWQVGSGSLLGTLRGHKKGIWCVIFSPVDQCLATASADATIRIWALSDLSCVKSFEGHGSSVLKVVFLTRGMQLLSSGSEGLLKLWTIKTNECVKTFDEHSDKVWALAVNKSGDVAVSGGADSLINIWKDVTEVEQEQAKAARDDQILKEQELSNLLHDKRYTEAIGLAITLNQPYKVLTVMKDILMAEEGLEQLTLAVTSLREDQLDCILKFLVSWNTNAKNSYVSQTVLSIILQKNSPYDLMKHPNIRETLEGLSPYTERHFQRITRLLQQMEFVEYTWQSMKLASNVTHSRADLSRGPHNDVTNFHREVATHNDVTNFHREVSTQNDDCPSPDSTPVLSRSDDESESERSDTEEDKESEGGETGEGNGSSNGHEVFELDHGETQNKEKCENKAKRRLKAVEQEEVTQDFTKKLRIRKVERMVGAELTLSGLKRKKRR